MMKTYIGVKVVQAEPETRDGKEGYKVVYSEPDKPDYTSWCPKDVFERHNRETVALPFSLALEACKTGKKIARKGWNGKNMWIRMFRPVNALTECNIGLQISRLTHPFLVIEYPEGHPAYLAGSCIPWLASQTDLLCDDWFIVE